MIQGQNKNTRNFWRSYRYRPNRFGDRLKQIDSKCYTTTKRRMKEEAIFGER